MDVQGPPIHYPSRQDSTAAIYQTQTASTSTTYQPPAYETTTLEYAPTPSGKEDATAKFDKTAMIRLASSVFVAVLVCIIVAAIIGRIESVEASRQQEKMEQG
ncbi:hypothetical protein S40285_10587 [Stachybotrys chlorohalonatus IBT 40285]|uniref:Uncharacterized protein n=1 Tax=Stachybotrys chlorohalonatus (strain IBT 40285) TaxID=1283841 RepID=A0A084QQ50_STAC4|nr:hypothetical protein S40285_10587 [Stachybotrys chlorohalonata IBT 40285]